jgi:hypothetical protein
MRKMRPWALVLILVTAAVPAYAYIDPNSGGLFFQLLTPIFVVVAAALAFAKRQMAQAWAWSINQIRILWWRLSRSSTADE